MKFSSLTLSDQLLLMIAFVHVFFGDETPLTLCSHL